MKPKLIVFLVVIVLVLIILFQNMHVVTFHVFFWKIGVSQVVLVLVMLAIGFVLGLLTGKLPRRE